MTNTERIQANNAELQECIEIAETLPDSDAYYDFFWDIKQDYGNLKNYTYSFGGLGWTDENYDPKYIIVTDNNPNRTNLMFAYATELTKIMTPLYFYDIRASNTFVGCSKLIKIGDDTGGGIWQTRYRTDSGNFSGCSKLEEIRYIDYNEKGEYMPTEIGNDIDFVSCKVLSMASAKNIISHLVNYTGTSEEGSYTITFHSEVKTRLEALEELAPSGNTWLDEISERGWNLA
jgi:hypothetical protein